MDMGGLIYVTAEALCEIRTLQYFIDSKCSKNRQTTEALNTCDFKKQEIVPFVGKYILKQCFY
jgi:hypothetical protein